MKPQMEEAVLRGLEQGKIELFFYCFSLIKINFAQPLPKMNKEDYISNQRITKQNKQETSLRKYKRGKRRSRLVCVCV